MIGPVEILSPQVIPLKPTDTVRFSLELMNDLQLLELPVVKDDVFLGMVSKSALSVLPQNTKIETVPKSSMENEIGHQRHIFDILGTFSKVQFTCLPVLDEHNHYIGAVTLRHVLEMMRDMLTIDQEGGIIILEMSAIDYTLSEIARITENDNISIVGLLISRIPDSGRILVHLKLNSMDIEHLLASFQRFDYLVVQYYSESIMIDNLKNRYEALMKFLDL
jgi:predicted transcriptional regulator